MKKLNLPKHILELYKIRDLSLAARRQKSESCQKILQKQQPQEKTNRELIHVR